MLEYFHSTDHDGDDIVLRVPTALDARCLERREQEIRAGVRRPGAEVSAAAQTWVLPFLAPVWMLRSASCDDGPGCSCQLVTLSMALDGLAGADRSRAVAAHIAVTRALSRHLDAASAVSAGLDELGDVCATCVTDTGEHVRALDAEISERGRELSDVVVDYHLRLVVEGPRG